MTSTHTADKGRVSRCLRSIRRRVSRSYALICAREDARRTGFVVPNHLPIQPRMQSFYD